MEVINSRLWVVDVEGNGASPPEIIELAMLELIDLEFSSNKRHWLLKPSQPIAAAVTRIHGLTDSDVRGAPSIDDIADEVLTWLTELPIVGHNVRVEVDAISRQIPLWKPCQAFDTLTLAKRLMPGLKSYGLDSVGRELDLTGIASELTGASHHSALYDATLAALIFRRLLLPLAVHERDVVLAEIDILNPRQGQLL